MKRLLTIPILIVAMFATSCSCSWRVARLQKLCPECFERDTLHLVDTMVPPPVPIFEHLGWDSLDHNGTFLIERPDYTFNVTVTDGGVDIEGEVRPDTLILEREVPVMVPCPEPDKKEQPWLLIGIMAVLVILVLVDTFKTRRR